MTWQRGESGNARGRPPKGAALAELLREAAEATGADGLTQKQALVNRLWRMALGGDLAAARLIFEYVDGKPVERVEARIGPAVQFTGDDAAEALAELRTWEMERDPLPQPLPRCDGRGGPENRELLE